MSLTYVNLFNVLNKFLVSFKALKVILRISVSVLIRIGINRVHLFTVYI